jgi:signal transduction histidine kinase
VPDEKRKEYLGTLRTEANRLGYLVENVLAYAQIERGRERKPLEEVQAVELLERIIPRLKERAKSLQVATIPPCLVKADRISVEQILFNLVDNASRYGGDQISMSLSLAKGALVISVTDQGPGVAPEVERKLFQPLRKSAAEAANGAQGIGLGLALSRRLARAMGGELRYRKGKGATFELSLPLR